MLDVYNDVKEILSNEEKCVLEWILGSSKYTDIIRNKITISKSNYEVSNTVTNKKDEYDDVIKAWKDEIINNKIYKTADKTPFSLPDKIEDEKIEDIYQKLIEKKFLAKRTTIDTFKYVLSGKGLNTYNEPVVWIKKQSKNSFYSKRTVFNFLRLLGIKWDQITPTRLNYCFICSNPSKKFAPFDWSNFTEKGKKGKFATSEYNNDIQKIIKSVLGAGHVICTKWGNESLDKLDEKQ